MSGHEDAHDEARRKALEIAQKLSAMRGGGGAAPPPPAAPSMLGKHTRDGDSSYDQRHDDFDSKRPRHDDQFAPPQQYSNYGSPAQQTSGYSGYGAPQSAPSGGGAVSGGNGQPLYVPNDRVGSLIGKAGANIKRIEHGYGVKVQIDSDPEPHRPTERRIVVVPMAGGQQGVLGAEMDIRRSLEEAIQRDAARAQGAGPVGMPNMAAATSTELVHIPQAAVGLLIGRAGDTIKQIQMKTGCHMQVTKDLEADPSSSTRPVTISGTTQQKDAAKYEIEMIVQQFQMRGGGQGPAGGMGVTTVPVMVSASIIGTIIGRGGDTIRMLQASTGAKVQVTRGFDGQPEREITISGTQQQIDAANAEVQRLIREKQNGGQFVTFAGAQPTARTASNTSTTDRNAPYPDPYASGAYAQGGAQAAWGQQYAAAYPGYDYSAYYAQQGAAGQQYAAAPYDYSAYYAQYYAAQGQEYPQQGQEYPQQGQQYAQQGGEQPQGDAQQQPSEQTAESAAAPAPAGTESESAQQ